MKATASNSVGQSTEEYLEDLGLVFPNLVCRTDDLTRDEWLEQRKEGIGGSDAAAVLGISPWTSTYALWAEKSGLSQDEKPQTDAMKMGNMLEPVVADLFAENEGRRIVELPVILSHPEYPHMLANVDRFVTDEHGKVIALLECKTSGARSANKWLEGVPSNYLAQVQHYLSVTGLPRAYVAVLVGGVDYHCFTVERDEMMIDLLQIQEAMFWTSLEKQIAPEVDGSEATIKVLRHQWQSKAETIIELPETAAVLLEQRAQAKQKASEVEEEIAECEAQLMACLQDNEVGTLGGEVVVTWKTSNRTSLDTKRLRAEKPELAREFERTSEVRTLRVK
jgi:putative phage-type endonuclease